MASKITISNRGEISEGLLAAGIAAKILKRDSNPVVNEEDIYDILEQIDQGDNIASSPKHIAKQRNWAVLDENKSSRDVVSLHIVLNKKVFADLIDSKKRPLLQTEMNGILKFVNRNHSERLTNRLFKNNKPDEIEIVSDGVTKSKETKVDVMIKINGRVPAQGKLSVKANRPEEQWSQIGKAREAMELLFDKLFGIEIKEKDLASWEDKVGRYKAPFTRDDIKKFGFRLYKDAFSQIKKKLRAAKTSEEIEFIKHMIGSGLKYEAGLEENGVHLVKFKDSDYHFIQLDGMEDIFKGVDLDVKMGSDKADLPNLIIFDKNSGESLFKVRIKHEQKDHKVRHYIEKQPKMDKLLHSLRK